MSGTRHVTPHCEACGRENPVTDEGYTACCNELVCYGDDQVWTDGAKQVHACCAAKAEAHFAGEDGDVGSFWRVAEAVPVFSRVRGW